MSVSRAGHQSNHAITDIIQERALVRPAHDLCHSNALTENVQDNTNVLNNEYEVIKAICVSDKKKSCILYSIY